jgi:hypothetical protein
MLGVKAMAMNQGIFRLPIDTGFWRFDQTQSKNQQSEPVTNAMRNEASAQFREL